MKHYKPIINMLRDYKYYLESDNYPHEYKRLQYSRISGYIFGYIQAWNYNNPYERFTNNQIDLIYRYIDALHDKYIILK